MTGAAPDDGLCEFFAQIGLRDGRSLIIGPITRHEAKCAGIQDDFGLFVYRTIKGGPEIEILARVLSQEAALELCDAVHNLEPPP
jgi:hypothetical protein